MSAPSQPKHRRPKPRNYGQRRALRLGDAEEAAVARMRTALAKSRGVGVDEVPFSDALRLLLTENEKAARVLAGRPEAWTSSRTLRVPDEAWAILSDCRNRVSHSQGSIYTIMRKLNFDEVVGQDEVREAFAAVQESKLALTRIEDRLVDLVTGAADEAVAQSAAESD
ncbi:hypothetical protein [Microbacterium halotolerans]|uniref:hypothetical protein n=1 Tax=Microbacterium halotolerans TaxID=246613 RepID=UPI000E6AAA15|nr:hypothetical protein [Microbacterium halotolerans]